LPKGSVNHCVNHGSFTSKGHFLSGNKQRQPAFWLASASTPGTGATNRLTFEM
jgi:hypothetical protein